MRIGMSSVFHDASPVLHQQMVLAALVPSEIELVDSIKIFSCILVKFRWKRIKHLFDSRGFHI